MKWKCKDFSAIQKLIKSASLSHELNKKDEKSKTKKRWAIKSGNGYKNPWDLPEKVRETI